MYGRGNLNLKESARLKRISLYNNGIEFQRTEMTENLENQKKVEF
jgi:hypothetical protein